jgi:hypothetical protein
MTTVVLEGTPIFDALVADLGPLPMPSTTEYTVLAAQAVLDLLARVTP